MKTMARAVGASALAIAAVFAAGASPASAQDEGQWTMIAEQDATADKGGGGIHVQRWSNSKYPDWVLVGANMRLATVPQTDASGGTSTWPTNPTWVRWSLDGQEQRSDTGEGWWWVHKGGEVKCTGQNTDMPLTVTLP